MSHLKIFNVIIFLLVFAAVTSCQKVIHIDLNSSSPQYVVQGNVTDTLGSYSVYLTKSINFNQNNTPVTVSGAIVSITDTNSKIVDSLYELNPGINPGFYQTRGIVQGIPGHTYYLYINANGKILTAYSTMPQPVPLDSIYVQIAGFRHSSYQVVPEYFDPATTGHFYHFILTQNDTVSGANYTRSDNLTRGHLVTEPLGGGGGSSNLGPIVAGDVLTVEMQCIDSMTYQFYFTLSQSQNANSATPTNPVSNIMGGQCLGYFSAHTSQSLSMVVPY